MKRAHCSRADQIRLAESKRMHILDQMSVSARQHVYTVIIRGLVPVRVKKAPEQRVPGVYLVIHSARRDPFVRLKMASEPDYAVRIVGGGKEWMMRPVDRSF